MTSSNPSIAEVENRSDAVIIRAKAVGTALLTAQYRGLEVYAVVSVHAAPGPVDVSFAWASPSTIRRYQRTALSAVAGGALGDVVWNATSVTGGATWTSSDPAIARVVAPGIVEGGYAGTVVVAASLGGSSASERVTVLPATLEQLAVEPFALALPAGTTYQLEAGGLYSDGGSASLRHAVTWWSEDAAIADFDAAPAGVLRAKAAGLTYVEARFDGKSARIPVTVF